MWEQNSFAPHSALRNKFEMDQCRSNILKLLIENLKYFYIKVDKHFLNETEKSINHKVK